MNGNRTGPVPPTDADKLARIKAILDENTSLPIKVAAIQFLIESEPEAPTDGQPAAPLGPREQIAKMLEILRGKPWGMRDTGEDSLVGILVRAYQCVDPENSRLFQRLEATNRLNERLKRDLRDKAGVLRGCLSSPPMRQQVIVNQVADFLESLAKD